VRRVAYGCTRIRQMGWSPSVAGPATERGSSGVHESAHTFSVVLRPLAHRPSIRTRCTAAAPVIGDEPSSESCGTDQDWWCKARWHVAAADAPPRHRGSGNRRRRRSDWLWPMPRDQPAVVEEGLSLAATIDRNREHERPRFDGGRPHGRQTADRWPRVDHQTCRIGGRRISDCHCQLRPLVKAHFR
jgi:hypothetical protein